MVKDLVPYADNPRQISKEQFEQLKRSIQKFDYVEPVVIQPDNTIIAGHMRVRAMMEMGWESTTISVRVPSRKLSEEEMREYLIRSNKNTGDWDLDHLANNFELSDLVEWGFTADDLDISLEPEDIEEKEEPKTCNTCGQKIRKKK